MGKTIGIVSGGQLGRMLTEAAMKLGYNVSVLDPKPNCPAAQVGANQVIGSWKDTALLGELVEQSDFFTFEIEHIDADYLAQFINTKQINPRPATISLIQNKFNQKQFLQQQGFDVGEFAEITSLSQAHELMKKWGGELILKAKTDAYDGRGNVFIKTSRELEVAMNDFGNRELYAEKVINFRYELAVIVAKDFQGKIDFYPVVQTIHVRNICNEVYAPANVSPDIQTQATAIAESVVKLLDGAGVYGIELFLSEENKILINEIAPRVHNSGHYTMDGCATSQFDQHIRAITGMDLGSTKLTVPACVMVNILGERNGETQLKGVEEAEAIGGVSVYIYGKSPTKIDRKMGHINAIGATIEEARDKAHRARRLISI